MRLRKSLFPGNYPQIYGYPWSFHIWIHLCKPIFKVPTYITMSTCTWNFTFFHIKTKINRVCGLESYTFYEYISEYFFRDFLVKIFPAKVPSIQDYGLMIEDQISNQKKDITFFSLTSIFAPWSEIWSQSYKKFRL